MATGATEFVDKTIADGVFIPDIWSKKVLKALETKLVMAKLVNRAFEDDAKIGKNVLIPSIGNLAARAKSENTAIVYETIAEAAVTLALNLWTYAAFGIEDIVDVQSNVTLRDKYQAKMGYALAKDLDTRLAALVQGLSQTKGALGTYITDQLIRDSKEVLDNADVDEEGRFFVFSPAEHNNFLGTDKYVNSLYRGDRPIESGKVGNLYGMDWHVSNNLRKAGANQADCMIGTKEAFALAMQREPRMHLFYDIDYFTWKVASEQIFGLGEIRDTCGVWVKGRS